MLYPTAMAHLRALGCEAVKIGRALKVTYQQTTTTYPINADGDVPGIEELLSALAADTTLPQPPPQPGTAIRHKITGSTYIVTSTSPLVATQTIVIASLDEWEIEP